MNFDVYESLELLGFSCLFINLAAILSDFARSGKRPVLATYKAMIKGSLVRGATILRCVEVSIFFFDTE